MVRSGREGTGPVWVFSSASAVVSDLWRSQLRAIVATLLKRKTCIPLILGSTKMFMGLEDIAQMKLA